MQAPRPPDDPLAASWNDSVSGNFLWSNVNFGEAIPSVMTPLTWSAAQTALREWVFIPGRSSLGQIGGRPYSNLSVFASLFRALGRGRQALVDSLEATMTLRLPEDVKIPVFRLSAAELMGSVRNGIRIRERYARGAAQVDAYIASNPGWFSRISAEIAAAAGPQGLARLWFDDLEPHLKHGAWCVLGCVDRSTSATMRLRRELGGLVDAEDAGYLLGTATAGEGPAALASLGPIAGVGEVAAGRLSPDVYLALQGHRGSDEFEISAPRPAEDPAWLDRQVETWRLHPADVGALVEAQQERFTEAWSRLGSLPARREAGLRRLLAESVKWARLREQARSEYVRDRWAVRRFALRAGALTGAGDDVFYLTVPELIGLLEGDRSPLGLVDGRRRTYHDYAALPSYPPLILGRFDPASWASDPNRRADFFNGSSPSDSLVPAPSSTGGAITGIPASAGTVEGVARVLRRPDEGCELREGEVLVAVQTDVAWTLLFARAAAVVTDVGAPLSHAAIVARELGIPAVVGCGDATARLRTGDRVRVDGTRGVVTPL